MANASMKLCSISGAQTPSASWLLVSLSSSNSLESYFAIWELIVSETPDRRTASFPCGGQIVKNCHIQNCIINKTREIRSWSWCPIS